MHIVRIALNHLRRFDVAELAPRPGINLITGDYSRGAAGFMVEGGEPAHPVDGVTIAGTLKQMFESIEAVGADIDPRSHLRVGPILIGRMSVAGQ